MYFNTYFHFINPWNLTWYFLWIFDLGHIKWAQLPKCAQNLDSLGIIQWITNFYTVSSKYCTPLTKCLAFSFWARPKQVLDLIFPIRLGIWLFSKNIVSSFVFSFLLPCSLATLRARAHLAFAFALALLFFDVCRYLPSLGVFSTIENNGSQMHCKSKRKRKH